MIYLSTAIGLTPGGSGTVHIYTQTAHRTTQITTNLEECGLCPVFVSFTLAFALQLRKECGKTSVSTEKRKNNAFIQYRCCNGWFILLPLTLNIDLLGHGPYEETQRHFFELCIS
jgi:hypothetical protein